MPPFDVNEAAEVDWLPLSTIEARAASGEILGAGSIIGILAVMRKLGH